MDVLVGPAPGSSSTECSGRWEGGGRHLFSGNQITSILLNSSDFFLAERLTRAGALMQDQGTNSETLENLPLWPRLSFPWT